MIQKEKETFGVSQEISYNTSKIESHRKMITCQHRGTATPMEPIKPTILDIATMRGRMNQPLTMAEGLLLPKSLNLESSTTESSTDCTYKKESPQLF